MEPKNSESSVYEAIEVLQDKNSNHHNTSISRNTIESNDSSNSDINKNFTSWFSSKFKFFTPRKDERKIKQAEVELRELMELRREVCEEIQKLESGNKVLDQKIKEIQNQYGFSNSVTNTFESKTSIGRKRKFKQIDAVNNQEQGINHVKFKKNQKNSNINTSLENLIDLFRRRDNAYRNNKVTPSKNTHSLIEVNRTQNTEQSAFFTKEDNIEILSSEEEKTYSQSSTKLEPKMEQIPGKQSPITPKVINSSSSIPSSRSLAEAIREKFEQQQHFTELSPSKNSNSKASKFPTPSKSAHSKPSITSNQKHEEKMTNLFDDSSSINEWRKNRNFR